MAKNLAKPHRAGKSGDGNLGSATSGDDTSGMDPIYSDADIEEMRAEYEAEQLKEHRREQDEAETAEEEKYWKEYEAERNGEILSDLAHANTPSLILQFASDREMDASALTNKSKAEEEIVSRLSEARAVAVFVAETISSNSDEMWTRLSHVVRTMGDEWLAIMERRARVVKQIERFRAIPRVDPEDGIPEPFRSDTAPSQENLRIAKANAFISAIAEHCDMRFRALSPHLVSDLLHSSKSSTLVAAHLSAETGALIKEDLRPPTNCPPDKKDGLIRRAQKDYDGSVRGWDKRRGTYKPKHGKRES